MFVFTEFRNISIQLNLVPFDWLMFTVYIILEPLFEMCSFFITCVEILINCNFFIEVFIE